MSPLKPTIGSSEGSTRTAPQPPGLPLVGNLFALQRKGQLQYNLDNWHQFGDIVRLKLGPFIVHMLAHPDYIRHVLIDNRQNYGRGRGYQVLKLLTGEGLLTSEGAFWKQQRRLIQPAFTPKAIPTYAPNMTSTISRLLERWEVVADRGDAIDVQAEMLQLALQIIGKTILSLNLDREAADLVEAFTTAVAIVGARITAGLDVPLRLPTPANRRFKRALHTLDSWIYALLAERQAHPNQYTDLLAHLLTAHDEETGTRMSPQQIRDEVMTIFFAGHETIAQTLTWAWYLLAQYPAIEEGLHSELAATLGARLPEVSDLPKLPYARMIIQETMRLYPAVWAIPRGAIAEDDIGGYHIPAGSMVFPTPYLAHRHPEFWERPEQFEPQRFATEQVVKLPDGTYLPFGAGPRACIGRYFAFQEALLVMVMIAQRYRLRLVPGHTVVPHSAITLSPKHGIWMRLERQ